MIENQLRSSVVHTETTTDNLMAWGPPGVNSCV